MSYNTLKFEVAADVATITFNRPDKRNAISLEMVDELMRVFDEAENGPARTVIFTGAQKAFCAGMDLQVLKASATESRSENLEHSRRMARIFRRVWSFPKVTIAAVDGPAIGGGCGIATLCDFTLASPEARFGYPEVRTGFLPAVVSVFLTRQIGEKHARDLLLTGRIFDAHEAYRFGLLTRIVSAETLIAEAHSISDQLRACSPVSLLKTKKLLYAYIAPDLDRDLELAIEESAQIRATSDFREGLSAFLEKRRPQWTGK
jgi:methylglutaconyl-CoA hydratase